MCCQLLVLDIFQRVCFLRYKDGFNTSDCSCSHLLGLVSQQMWLIAFLSNFQELFLAVIKQYLGFIRCLET